MASSRQEELALQYLAQADKELNKFSLWGDSKYENARELYKKAANQFKIAKKMQECGDTWVKCGECEMRLKSPSDAANSFKEAGAAYKKTSPEDSVRYFNEAISLYCDNGRFGTAAKLEREIAEMHEADDELQEAIDHYQKAADYFSGENEKAQRTQCEMKIALHSASLMKYSKPIDIFEETGKAQLENNLLKFNAKGNFMNAGICKLASGDVVATKIGIDKYKDWDYTFATSRECKFLENLATAVENLDAEAFTQTVFDYDSSGPKLNPWTVTLLLRIKASLKEEATGADDLT